MTSGMTRQTFLRTLTLASAGWALPVLSGCARPEDGTIQKAARACVSSPTAAREIGAAYVAAFPEEDTAAALAGKLAHALGLAPARWPRHLSVTALREALHKLHDADFEQRRTIVLHHWVLSRTEARLCALSYVDPTT